MTASQDNRIGRPVRIVSIGYSTEQMLETVVAVADEQAARDTDIIAMQEMSRGHNPERLDGPAVTAFSDLARRHNTHVVLPIDRTDGERRFNSAVLIDRSGEVVCVYDKVYPFWSELKCDVGELDPPITIGREAPVYQADFGRVGMAICFDANFDEVWHRMADQAVELVIWPSAYSAGMSLQAHAINHNFYIVTATYTRDCAVYDITGREVFYEKSEDEIHISRVTVDLDRGIYHTNFNIEKRDKLLAEHADDVEQELLLEREQWFVLRAKRPGVSARALAREYGLEELRDFKSRSRREIDRMRGWAFADMLRGNDE